MGYNGKQHENTILMGAMQIDNNAMLKCFPLFRLLIMERGI